MSAAAATLKEKLLHEVKRMLFVSFYFLVGFNLLALLLLLLSPYEGSKAAVFSSQCLLALVVAKVVLLADSLIARRIKRIGGFLPAIARKSAVYTVVILLALAIEAVVHQRLGPAASWGDAFRRALAESTGPRFMAKAIYLFVLFCFYSFLSELDPYFSPRSLTDIVLSRYSTARQSQAVVLRFGILQTELDATTRLELLDKLFAKMEHRVVSHGAQLELFGSARGVAIWENQDSFRREDAQDIYDYFAEELSLYCAAAGRKYEAKAVVVLGELLTYEAHGEHRREIVRDGSALDHANRQFEQLERAELFFCA